MYVALLIAAAVVVVNPCANGALVLSSSDAAHQETARVETSDMSPLLLSWRTENKQAAKFDIFRQQVAPEEPEVWNALVTEIMALLNAPNMKKLQTPMLKQKKLQHMVHSIILNQEIPHLSFFGDDGTTAKKTFFYAQLKSTEGSGRSSEGGDHADASAETPQFETGDIVAWCDCELGINSENQHIYGHVAGVNTAPSFQKKGLAKELVSQCMVSLKTDLEDKFGGEKDLVVHLENLADVAGMKAYSKAAINAGFRSVRMWLEDEDDSPEGFSKLQECNILNEEEEFLTNAGEWYGSCLEGSFPEHGFDYFICGECEINDASCSKVLPPP